MTGEKTSDYIAWDDCPKVEEALFNAKQYRIYCYLAIGRNLAIRAKDMMKLRWVDLLGDSIAITESKTGKTRKIHIAQETHRAVERAFEQLKAKPDEKIFKSSSKSGEMSSQYISKQLRYYAAPIVGWDKKISTHTVRKTFGRHVYENAADKTHALVMLNEIFQHSSLAITRRYIGITAFEVEEIYKQLYK